MKKLTHTGMTLIELLIVITVIGILSSVAVSKITSSGTLTLGQQATKFSHNIRHAQTLAQFWGCTLVVEVTTNSYEVRNKAPVTGKTKCSTTDTIIVDPSTRENFDVNLEYGVQFSSTGIFDFSHKGIPEDNATGNDLAALTNFNITDGTNTITISVSHITGFVEVTGP